MHQEIKCRVAPSLGGGFAGTPEKVWGTKPYNAETDKELPCVFFGLYGLPDFYALWRHKGKKWILWAGSDIRHFISGYWLAEKGEIKIEPRALAKWINKNCENWTENEIEANALKKFGIKSKICPSFMGNKNKYPISYQWNKKPKVYASVSGNDFLLYRWPEIEILGKKYSDIEFYLYGNTAPWRTKNKNVIIRGRISQDMMNEEIQDMQGGLRLLPFEGFSEIVAKGILWGQYPISAIKYPHTLSISEIGKLKNKKEPNFAGRKYYFNMLNKYPWNCRM
ncbi:MAG: hypothetical protein US68_C0028G0003 [Candidatus Shapirobacteria bacterium GW2011_GWE1_38_10]|uniref:Uncharacterized protein n=2 Tax=Patescibacteria group TaxID=1783273 RepID=A0A0G0L7E3_9BACT|nr:MAG: hypothetical protein US68_C0028G0003 [Candidatus Shapirobacteria bacterium GW2011_GWE1_38_10]KKR20049.1 MAG: hypothetical protein UT51_C0009G0023 [Candidatus Nomurabacteria bacterium GW2011_GWC2_39_41]